MIPTPLRHELASAIQSGPQPTSDSPSHSSRKLHEFMTYYAPQNPNEPFDDGRIRYLSGFLLAPDGVGPHGLETPVFTGGLVYAEPSKTEPAQTYGVTGTNGISNQENSAWAGGQAAPNRYGAVFFKPEVDGRTRVLPLHAILNDPALSSALHEQLGNGNSQDGEVNRSSGIVPIGAKSLLDFYNNTPPYGRDAHMAYQEGEIRKTEAKKFLELKAVELAGLSETLIGYARAYPDFSKYLKLQDTLYDDGASATELLLDYNSGGQIRILGCARPDEQKSTFAFSLSVMQENGVRAALPFLPELTIERIYNRLGSYAKSHVDTAAASVMPTARFGDLVAHNNTLLAMTHTYVEYLQLWVDQIPPHQRHW